MAFQKADHEAYTKIYVDEYLKMEAEHDGGLYSYDGTILISGLLTKEALYTAIHKISISHSAEGKIEFGPFVEGVNKKENGYYHGSPSGDDHTMTTHLHWDQVNITPLKAKNRCKGTTCNDMFTTDYEAYKTHRLNVVPEGI